MTERPEDPDAAAAADAAIEDARWLVVNGRRWPRPDPSLRRGWSTP
ncbi:hypothetical protein ACFOD2_16585 [Clavibacter michiganensis subsp. insidiosus]